MIKNLKNKKKGFTLIELIIVIAIIAILAAVAIPKFGEVRKNANEKSDIANAKTIANAVTALIAEGKLTVPSAEALEIDTTTANPAVTDSDKIEAYMQNVPVGKSVTGNFFVKIDANGGVIVTAGSASGTQFFPASSDQTN